MTWPCYIQNRSIVRRIVMRLNCKNKTVTVRLISIFVFTICIVQSLYFLNPKFKAPSLLLLLYRHVCVEPGQKPKPLIFSCKGSISFLTCVETFRTSLNLIIPIWVTVATDNHIVGQQTDLCSKLHKRSIKRLLSSKMLSLQS